MGTPEELELLVDELDEDELLEDELEDDAADEELELLPDDTDPAPPHPTRARIRKRETACFKNLI